MVILYVILLLNSFALQRSIFCSKMQMYVILFKAHLTFNKQYLCVEKKMRHVNISLNYSLDNQRLIRYINVVAHIDKLVFV